MTSRRALFCSVLLGSALLACQMNREEVLGKKVCSPDGECARGFTCVDGVCELADGEGTASRSNQLHLDAGAPSDAGVPNDESE